MKTMILAAVLSLGVGSAFAADAPQNGSGYAFPNFWGTESTQQAPATNDPPAANSATVGVYATHSGQHGTYLFPPNPYGNG